MSSALDTYRSHVIAETFQEYVPDFGALFTECGAWPSSLASANKCFADQMKGMVKQEHPSAYLNFVNTLLMDQESFSVAKALWEVDIYLKQKDPKALEKLYDLRSILLEMPTLLTVMPTGLLNVFRAVKQPTKRNEWGLLLLSKKHRLHCAECSKRVEKDFVRVRCQCNTFGVLMHKHCLRCRRCFVCSTPYSVQKVQKKS